MQLNILKRNYTTACLKVYCGSWMDIIRISATDIVRSEGGHELHRASAYGSYTWLASLRRIVT